MGSGASGVWVVPIILMCSGWLVPASTADADGAAAPSSPAVLRDCVAMSQEHEGPPRYPYPRVTEVVVLCGDTEGVVLRASSVPTALGLRWQGEKALLISVPAGTRVLTRSTAFGDVSVAYDPSLLDSDIAYGVLPPSQWPSTCASAARQIAEVLPGSSREIIRGLSPDELLEMRLYWGALLARHFALYAGNLGLLESCGGAASTGGAAIVDLVAHELRPR
jgi:hypothetical protein